MLPSLDVVISFAHQNPLTLAGGLATLVLLHVIRIIYLVYIYPIFLSPLRNYPGPAPYPFLYKGKSEKGDEFDGHWFLGQWPTILKEEAGKAQWRWVRRWATGLGWKASKENPTPGQPRGVVRVVGPLGMERLIFATPKAYQTILVDRPADFPRPRFFMSVLKAVAGHGLLSTKGDEHKAIRRMMSPAFTVAHLGRMVPEFWPIIGTLKQVLNKEIDENGGEAILDMHDYTSRCTLDIISWTAFGYHCGSLSDKHNELADAYHTLIGLQSGPNLARSITIHWYSVTDFLAPYIMRFVADWVPLNAPFGIGTWAAPIKTLTKSMDRIKKISRELLREKGVDVDGKGNSSIEKEENVQERDGFGGKDVLSILVRSNAGEAGGGKPVLSNDGMVDQVLTVLGAGSETTASGTTWALWLLAQNPEKQSILRKEVSALLESKEEPSMADLNGDGPSGKMDYLEWVIKETLRVYPSVPMTVRSAAVDTEIDGTFVKAGTMLYLAIRVMNTLPEYWGEDALDFRPERWDKIPDEQARLLMSFIAGPHTCIGNKMAMIEMKAMLAVLIANFEFSLLEEGQEIIASSAITMKPRDGLPLRVRRVKTGANSLS